MNAKKITTLKDQLVRNIKADPKKATVLAGLAIVMVFMWVRMVGGSKTGPAAAVAKVATERTELVGKRLHGEPAVRPSNVNQQLQEWARRPVSPLSRNLFTINYDFFPQDGSKVATLRVPSGDGFWDQVAKSMTARADQRKEREVLVENLRLQAAQLKVQSTMMGAKPRALINGDLVGEGDVVASFRVYRIEARRVIVEREGIKLEIRLN